MAANIERKIVERIRELADDQQAEVLKFVEDLANHEAKPENGHSTDRVAIWDKIDAIMSDVPDEVLASIPNDGSLNVDHYLYGSLKG